MFFFNVGYFLYFIEKAAVFSSNMIKLNELNKI